MAGDVLHHFPLFFFKLMELEVLNKTKKSEGDISGIAAAVDHRSKELSPGQIVSANGDNSHLERGYVGVCLCQSGGDGR